MLATMLYGKEDVRLEEGLEPAIQKATDAIVRLAATCICESDRWPYRICGDDAGPEAMGHEYCGSSRRWVTR